MTTTSEDVRLNGAVTLSADVRIDTDETAATGTGGADVLFTNDAPIDSQLTEANDLVIDAGVASVFFNEDLGAAAATSELGRLEIEQADGGVTFGQADTETALTGSTGPLNAISLVGDGTVGNALPSITTVTIGPSNPTESDTISATIAGWSDAKLTPSAPSSKKSPSRWRPTAKAAPTSSRLPLLAIPTPASRRCSTG